MEKKIIVMNNETGTMVNENVSEVVNQIFNIDLNNPTQVEGIKKEIDMFAIGIQKKAFEGSEKLKQPIHKIAQKGEDGKEVAESLLSLKNQIETLDPTKVNFDKKSSFFNLFKSPAKKYFEKYTQADEVISTIITTLQDGAESLKRDNVFLNTSIVSSKETLLEITKAIEFGQELDNQLSEKIYECTDDNHRKFLEQEVLFSVRQRLTDLNQQMLLNQQAIISTEIITRNNKELI
ncbi:MAG: toxic anion resistance protein, partial [Anaeroplasmataceae bacterium]